MKTPQHFFRLLLTTALLLGVTAGCRKKEESIVEVATSSPEIKATRSQSKQAETTRDENAELLKTIRPEAERGDAESQYLLGIFHTSGNGVPLDYVEAFKWLQLAAAQDDKEAIKARDLVAKLLTREQRAEADKRVAAFTKSTTTARP